MKCARETHKKSRSTCINSSWVGKRSIRINSANLTWRSKPNMVRRIICQYFYAMSSLEQAKFAEIDPCVTAN